MPGVRLGDKRMKYIEMTSTDPYMNLATEEYVFENMDRHESYFMLWQNDNAIIIGKHQNTVEEINQEFVDAHGIRVARRLTGGGAVYHDKGNLNFTFIVDEGAAEDFNFHVFVEPVLKVLHKYDIPADFTGRNDLTIDGMKFSGNSQYAKHGRLLVHGCVMLDANADYLTQALKVKQKKYESRGIKSVRSRVTCINDHFREPMPMTMFKQLLLKQVFAGNDIEQYILNETDLAAIQKLRDEKYATWEWNYGKSPAYNMKREKKFPAGLVTIYMQANKGRIEDIHFYGDFFGSRDLKELENKFTGLPLDDQLLEKMKSMDIGSYMNGISAEDIYQLIRYE
jgi:lipoate-protein ligase A